MRFTMSRSGLLDQLNKVRGAVSDRSTIPILSHALIQSTDSGGISIIGTDTKISIESICNCDVDVPGAFTVSCSRLYNLVSEMPDDDITLDSDGSKVAVSCGKINTKLFSYPATEYPSLIRCSPDSEVDIPSDVLLDLFLKTFYSVSREPSRRNLNGLLFEVKSGKLTTAGTDGRRMSVSNIDIDSDIDARVIIPHETIKSLFSLLKTDGITKVFIDNKNISFSIGHTRLVSSLIEGNYPDYNIVISVTKDHKEYIVDTSKLSESVRRANSMVNDKFKSISLSIDDGGMQIKTLTPEVGEYNERIEAESNTVLDVVKLNPQFLTETLRHIDTDKTLLLIKDSGSQVIVKPLSNNNYTNVIMPVRE